MDKSEHNAFYFQFSFLKTSLPDFCQTCLNFSALGACEWVPHVYGWLKRLSLWRMFSCFLFKALVINLNCLSDIEGPDSKTLSFPSCPLPSLAEKWGMLFLSSQPSWSFELSVLVNLLQSFRQFEIWGIRMAGSDLLRLIPREQRLEHNSDLVNDMNRDFLHINHISICF